MSSLLWAVSRFDPLTYLVDALRCSMVPAGASEFGLGFDFLVLTGMLVGLTFAAARLYPNVVR